MIHRFAFVVASIAAVVWADAARAQLVVPSRQGGPPTADNQALRPNAFEAAQPATLSNAIIKPMPLTAAEKDSALAGIDRHIAENASQVRDKLKTILPDELAILAKTAGWSRDDQQALTTALRAGDPAAVYEAWTQGNPKDGAGAEIVARQVDVKRVMARFDQNLEQNPTSIGQDVADLDAALTKISASTPGTNELTPMIGELKTWIEARQLVEAATPGTGSVAKLPTGKISLIHDPGQPVGTAIVLSDKAMLIGNQGRGPLSIELGNAAEALGLPIVTGDAVADLQGAEPSQGILIFNPESSKGTVNYNVNGQHFVAEPGMVQRLDGNTPYVVEFDRGQGFGPSVYRVRPGSYEFTPTDLGWQLYRTRYDVVMDNSANQQEFHFIFNGEAMTVPAGGAKTLTSDYPIVVRYDRGNGSEFVAKMMKFSGNVQVGVNAADNMWDLFPTSDNRRETANLKLFQNR